MVTSKEPAVKQDGPAAHSALLFEMDNLAVPGQSIMFGVIRRILGEKDVKLDRYTFAKHCLHSCPEHFTADLLAAVGKTNLSAEKMAERIRQETNAAMLGDGAPKPPAGLKKLLLAAAERSVPIGALSGLEDDTAAALLDKLGLAEFVTQRFCCPGQHRYFPSADGWLKLARAMNVSSPLCVAVVTGATPCRSALAAGMRCAVIYDEMTEAHDFGGADCVADRLDEGFTQAVLRLLR